MIIEKMTELVEKNTKYYKSDFYDHDLKQLESATDNNYIWILRTSGTWLFPENESSNIYEYCLTDSSVIAYYKLDLKKDTLKAFKPQPLKHYTVIYKNSDNVFIQHKTVIPALNLECAHVLAQKMMDSNYNYFEIA